MLLIRGGLDREINARLASTLAVLREKPGSRVVDLPGAGHFANLEQPEAFNQTLEEFLYSITDSAEKSKEFTAECAEDRSALNRDGNKRPDYVKKDHYM